MTNFDDVLKEDLMIDNLRFHLVRTNDFRVDAVNIVNAVEVTEDIEKACLGGFSVYLVHDLFMFETLIKSLTSKIDNKKQKKEWKEIAQWMTWDSKPLKISENHQTLQEFMESSDTIKEFMDQDYELLS